MEDQFSMNLELNQKIILLVAEFILFFDLLYNN
jgi:hypothetical protein